MNSVKKIFLVLSALSGIVLLVGIIMQQENIYKPFALVTAISFAIGLGAVPSLKGYQYTAWIISAVVAGMIFPEAFKSWGGVNLRDKTLILVIIQLVMFGMGTHMSLKDFSGLASTGKGVLVGLFCHFSIMPLMGLLLTKIFHFEPEIAAGIILIGSCSSGLASNVMVYLAKANLVLSVIVTAMATLVAPLLTPLLMKTFASTLININFIDMMMEIVKIVLVPIGAALLHDFLKRATAPQKKIVHFLFGAAIIFVGMVLFLVSKETEAAPVAKSIVLTGFFAGAIIAGVLYNYLHQQFPKLDTIMPLISMVGIIYFTTVTTAAGRENLMKVGVLLFIASVIHNAAGYFFGYWLSRLFGMDINSSRTIAFEVGLQNGGMASGIAGSMGKLGTVGLAPAVFSPWMNISGSILANYWRRKPVETQSHEDIKEH
ncbi:bile acid:sodium symporter family protein [Ferruginibacter sp. SUN106]|uniref:bile acid:sodium symporter family protein n=1 Tax=Ferruginibacter sp. SUN106 TaxID=2978348 RepID=UPI003D36555A